jgi:hypothetical protein
MFCCTAIAVPLRCPGVQGRGGGGTGFQESMNQEDKKCMNHRVSLSTSQWFKRTICKWLWGQWVTKSSNQKLKQSRSQDIWIKAPRSQRVKNNRDQQTNQGLTRSNWQDVKESRSCRVKELDMQWGEESRKKRDKEKTMKGDEQTMQWVQENNINASRCSGDKESRNPGIQESIIQG